jgi:hypothetical protein
VSSSFDPRSVLRWYPAAWRERYGDELVAMVEDDLEGRRPPLRMRASLLAAGLRERAHSTGLTGDGASDPARRLRAGSLVVLAAFALFAVAGAGYAKLSEHFTAFMPAGPAATAQTAYDLVAAFAAVSAAATVLGAMFVLPAFVCLLRAGGWERVKRPILQLVAFGVATTAATAGLAFWAHHLAAPARNGGDAAYTVGVLGLALLLVGTLALTVRVVVASTQHLEISLRVLRAEGALAALVFLSMLTMTGATAWWWATTARSAPGFLGGGANGIDPRMIGTMAMMLLADAGSALGVRRLARR